jgi:hypothetical protein
MYEELSPENLISCIKQSFGEFRDVRKGKNTQYDMVDAGVGACLGFLYPEPILSIVPRRYEKSEWALQYRKSVWNATDTL